VSEATASPGAFASTLALVRRIKARGDDLAPAVFLPFALLVGLLFVFLIPPTQVLDESSHFLRAWQIAELNVEMDARFDEATGLERNGAVYDACVIEYMGQLSTAAAQPQDMAYGSFWNDTPDCSPQQRQFYFVDSAAGYGPWSYAGHLVGLMFGRAVGLPLPVIFYLGRITGLLAYVGIVWSALKLTPSARLPMFFVATLPMSMMTAAAYQTDGTVLASVVFMCACLLRFVLVPEARSTRLAVGMTIAAGVAIASKPNLVVLVPLLLLLPAPAGVARGRWNMVRTGAAGATLATVAVWHRFWSGVSASEIYYPDSDPEHQAAAVLKHPIGFLRLVWHTAFDYTSEVFMVRGWVGIFGMQRGRDGVAPLLPMLLVVLAFGVGVLAHFVLLGERREMRVRTRAFTVGVFTAILVAGPLSVFYAAFTQWTAPGAPRIEGVQARYFLPYLPVAAAGLAILRKRSNLQISTGFVGLAALFLAIASVNQMMLLFY
jgi:uncharacterized membrane protein